MIDFNSEEKIAVISDSPNGSHICYVDEESKKFPFKIYLDLAAQSYCFQLMPSEETADADLTVVFRFRLSDVCPNHHDDQVRPLCSHFHNYITVRSTDTEKIFKRYEHPLSPHSNFLNNHFTAKYSVVSAWLSAPSAALVSEQSEHLAVLLKEMNIAESVKLCVANQEFEVSKSLLFAHSAVFKRMFDAGLAETQNSTVNIVDFSPSTVENMLKYLKTGGKIAKSECTSELFQLAHKYDIRLLMERCVDELCRSVSAENVLQLMKFPCEFGRNRVKSAVFEFVHKSENRDYLRTDEFSAFADENCEYAAELFMVLVEFL